MDKNIWHISGNLADYEISLKDGQYFIRYRVEKLKNEPFIAFTSTRDPEKEALRISGGFKLKNGLIAIVVGVGAIKLIEILKQQQRDNGGDIIIFEADEKLSHSLKNIIPGLFNGLNVVSPENNHLENIIERYPVENMMGYRLLILAQSFNLAPDFYRSLELSFKSAFSTRFSDLLTRIEFEGRWILNGFLNLSRLFQAVPVSALYNCATGENALLVSSGPSLRASLPWIKANQDRYFIGCVDSAWRVLNRAGIIPHMVFTLDSQIFTKRHFQGLTNGTPGQFPILYTDIISNPMILRDWRGNTVYGITAHFADNKRTVTPGCDYIEDNFLLHSCGDLQSGGSVATSLFDLMRNMNFKTITLVGQDLAFTNREIHSTGTHHTDIWLSKNIHRLESLENINNKVLKKRHISWSKSIKGRRLPEDYIFSVYRNWFEESISKISVRVMNATGDGAVIKGVDSLETPDVNISEGFINRLKDIVFKNNLKFINEKAVFTFYKEVMEFKATDGGKEFNNLPFMDRIGKKFLIKYLRNKTKYGEKWDERRDVLLQMQRREQLMFWKTLKKRMFSVYSRILKT